MKEGFSFFTDKCQLMATGLYDRGPTIIAIILMVSIVLGCIFLNVAHLLSRKSKKRKENDKYIQISINIVCSFISLFIIYKMSYNCNLKMLPLYTIIPVILYMIAVKLHEQYKICKIKNDPKKRLIMSSIVPGGDAILKEAWLC
tara:strand:+ start:3197 stop:3628 length:432 start_codon:yes stop_codon:yes gene_type:complete